MVPHWRRYVGLIVAYIVASDHPSWVCVYAVWQILQKVLAPGGSQIVMLNNHDHIDQPIRLAHQALYDICPESSE